MTLKMLISACAVALAAVGCAQSDAGITTAVKGKLVADELVKARQINVDTRDKVVTLSGQVETSAEESRALQLARDTKGVRDVVDQITVVAPRASFGLPEPGAPPATR
jgi:hyperosmotically inducible protein